MYQLKALDSFFIDTNKYLINLTLCDKTTKKSNAGKIRKDLGKQFL